MHFSIGKTTSYKSIKRACSLRLVQFNFILGPSTITFAGYDATIKCCVICIIFIITGEPDELQTNHDNIKKEVIVSFHQMDVDFL